MVAGENFRSANERKKYGTDERRRGARREYAALERETKRRFSWIWYLRETVEIYFADVTIYFSAAAAAADPNSIWFRRNVPKFMPFASITGGLLVCKPGQFAAPRNSEKVCASPPSLSGSQAGIVRRNIRPTLCYCCPTPILEGFFFARNGQTFLRISLCLAP